MDKDKLRNIIYIVIAVIISAIAINIFIWLLPFILIALLAYFIYSLIKKDEIKKERDTTHKQKTTKKKKIIIIDEEK